MPTPTATTYVLADVTRLTRAKRAQIEYWVRKGLIRGEFEHGTGLPRQFVFRNLVETSIAVELTALGLSTWAIFSLLDELRSGDVETDVRTAWFVEMTSKPAIEYRKPSRKEMRESDAAFQASRDNVPREEQCCAELNDDGTIKLLKLLRAYVEAGVSGEEARKALMGVAREHIRDGRRWVKANEALHRRWRQFKNPKTRPASAQFWLVATLWSSDGQKGRWLHTQLTDFKDRDGTPQDSAVVVPIRQTLERLELATNDSWPATPEKRVVRVPEATVAARRLVDQAFKEYERTEQIKELRALGRLPTPKEHDHAHH